MSNSVKPDVLEKRIKEILKGADLDSLSVKKVRTQLESEFKADLNDQKELIGDIIKDVINSKDKLDKNTSNDEDEDDDEEDEKESDDDDNDDDYGKPSRAKRSTTKSKKTKAPPKAKKPAKKRKRSSDDDGDDDDEKPKKRSNKGYMKTCKLSEDLAALVGESELPRHQVVKKIWGYVKEKGLYDPKNKQFALCDDAMLKIFGMKRFRLFGMMKHLSKHIK